MSCLPADLPHMSEPKVQENFEVFFNGWLVRQQNLLDQLLIAMAPENAFKTDNCSAIVDQVLAHYREYYSEKSKAANEDVFLFFSPPWFSSFERTLFWIGGFKPSVIFKLIYGSIKELTAEQEQRMEQLKAKIRKEERELAETLARIQESVAAPPLMKLARQLVGLVDGKVTELNEATEGLKKALLEALNRADKLRGKVTFKVVEILKPNQTVSVMAAVAQFQLRVRRWGWQRDSERDTATAFEQ